MPILLERISFYIGERNSPAIGSVLGNMPPIFHRIGIIGMLDQAREDDVDILARIAHPYAGHSIV